MIPKANGRILFAVVTVYEVIGQQVSYYLIFAVFVDRHAFQHLRRLIEPLFVIDGNVDLSKTKFTVVGFQLLSTKSSTLSYFFEFSRLLFFDFPSPSSAMIS
jgi:hypothetical protein